MRIDQLIARNGSVADALKDVPLLWSPENGIDSTQVQAKSTKKYKWICKDCGHRFTATVYRTIIEKVYCPECTKRRWIAARNKKYIDERGSFAEELPELAAEWNHEKNGVLNPKDFTLHSSAHVWWRCVNGHSWKAAISSRVTGTGCPKCRMFGTSHIELRLYAELLHFFPDALLRYKIDGHEIDIYLPSENIGVEIDGYRWHTEDKNAERDAAKNAAFNSKIPLIRLRDQRLPMLSDDDIPISHREQYKKIANKLLERIARQVPRLSGQVTSYVKGRNFVNPREYFRLLQRLPKPTKGKSFGEIFPEYLVDWAADLNEGLSPYDIYPTNLTELNWRCHKCGGIYSMSPLTKYQYGAACSAPGCLLPPQHRCLADVNPEMAAEWDYERNAPVKPENVHIKSKRAFWWICSQCGHSFKATPEKRVLYPGKYGCTNSECTKKHLENSIAKVRPDLIDEWVSEKNLPASPENTSVTSHQMIWWRCRHCGQERHMAPYHRSLVGTTCGSSACRRIVLLRKNGTTGRKKSYTAEQVEAMVRLYAEGKSLNEISAETGVSKSTISRVLIQIRNQR